MNTKAIISQMKAIKGIGKITKTMEMVSVAKMKRTTARAVLGRPYSKSAYDLIAKMSGQDVANHALIAQRTAAHTTVVVLIGPDKGLCGGYSTQLVRELMLYIAENPDTRIVTIGKAADKIVRRARGTVTASFGLLPELLDTNEVYAIVKYIIDTYLGDTTIAKCVVMSQHITSGVSVAPTVQQLIPLTVSVPDTTTMTQYQFEPGVTELLDTVLPGLIESILLQKILEARAAEHTARMVAMKNASDNASQYYRTLNLNYNRVRQAGITQEIAEIVGGASAI